MTINTKPNFNEVWADSRTHVPLDPTRFTAGWDAEIPPYEDMNNIQNQYGTQLKYVNENGVCPWDAQTSYGNSALTRGSNGILYVSRTTDNVNNDPISSTNFWLPMSMHQGVPGEIKMFDGDTATLSLLQIAGWRICDGANGTPNLVDRFIMGTGSTVTTGISAGSNTVTPAGSVSVTTLNAGSHSHSITVNGHALTEAQGPRHRHNGSTSSTGDHYHVFGGDDRIGNGGYVLDHRGGGDMTSEGSDGGTGFNWRTRNSGNHNHTYTTSYSGSGQAHSHGASSASGGSHNHPASGTFTGTQFDNRPQSYTVIYMKFFG